MKQQLNSLQLYRGIASILVVLHHGNIILDRELHQNGSFSLFHWGWVGVDFFFVLSGFIIFYIHQTDLGQPQRFRSFITKRFLRIYPLYWLILFGKIAISMLSDRQSVLYQTSLAQFAQAILLVPQAKANLENFIGVSWTLTYEVFFYLIFGLLILLKSKICQPLIIIWMMGIILNLFQLLPIQGSLLPEFIFNARNLEFGFGCGAAYIVSKQTVPYGKTFTYAALGILALAIINTKYQQFDVSGISPAIAYGIPFAILIIGSVQIEKNTTLPIPPVLIYLGNASYSIYLTHGFFINNITRIYIKAAERFDQSLLQLPPNSSLYLIVTTIIISLSIAIGCIVHTWVERPLMNTFRSKQLKSS